MHVNEKHLDTFLHYLGYFTLYSFFGWIIDSLYRSAKMWEWTHSSSIETVFTPVYGLGAIVFITVRPYIIKKHPLIQFVILGLSGGIVEYIGGRIAVSFTGHRLWDYSDALLNIQGHTDAYHIILWGILGMIFLQVIHPNVERFFSS